MTRDEPRTDRWAGEAWLSMITLIVRINPDRRHGMKGSVEVPGGESRTFHSDEDLLDTLYEWSNRVGESGKGSGSTSRSDMRAT